MKPAERRFGRWLGGTSWQSPSAADRIAFVARTPDEITRCSRNALAHSRAHAFHQEFRRGMKHLARIAGNAPRGETQLSLVS